MKRFSSANAHQVPFIFKINNKINAHGPIRIRLKDICFRVSLRLGLPGGHKSGPFSAKTAIEFRFLYTTEAKALSSGAEEM